MSEHNEIERKWIARKGYSFYRFIERVVPFEITQYYTKIDEESEVRMRRVLHDGEEEYIKTEKFGKGISRPETNIPITKEEFDSVGEGIVGKLIKKHRYKFIARDRIHTIEVDDYSMPFFGNLVAIEVEFNDNDIMEDIQRFDINEQLNLKPSVLSEFMDVTDDKRFKNKYIALHGFDLDTLLITGK